MFAVSPRDLEITNMEDPILEGEPSTVQCVISRVYPAGDVSVKWMYPSGISMGGIPEITKNEGEETYKLSYTTSIEFTRDDHNHNLTCCAQWRENTNFACYSRVIQVHCEYSN